MMKSLKLIAISLLMGICFSCSNDEGITQEQEAANLSENLAEIEGMATAKNCDNPSEWTFTDYGEKACGGPVGYIAYSTNIDTELFLEKIEAHRVAQKRFNEKWGIISDCSLPAEPGGIICDNGNPVFIY